MKLTLSFLFVLVLANGANGWPWDSSSSPDDDSSSTDDYEWYNGWANDSPPKEDTPESSSLDSPEESTPGELDCFNCCDEDEINSLLASWGLAVHHYVRAVTQGQGLDEATEHFTTTAELIFSHLETTETSLWTDVGPGARQFVSMIMPDHSERTPLEFIQELKEAIEVLGLKVYHEVDMGYEFHMLECNSEKSEKSHNSEDGDDGQHDHVMAMGMTTQTFISPNVTADTSELVTTLYIHREIMLSRINGMWMIDAIASEVF